MRELSKLSVFQEALDSVPDQFKEVFKESWRLGSRVFTTAKNTSETLRIYLEPEFDSIRNLTIFISYTTAEEDWASIVARQLSDFGFNIEFFPSIANSRNELNQRNIEDRLLSALNRSDYLCMLFSNISKIRPWVLFELEHAARLIGRVILLRNESVSSITELTIPAFQTKDFSVNCIKHALLPYNTSDFSMAEKLARIIINDPDEGVTDGSYRPYVIRERNLKRESIMRRYVRKQVGALNKYSSRNVIDIIPFFLTDIKKEIEVNRQEYLKVLVWFAHKHGRLNQLLHAINNSESKWEYSWETFLVPKTFSTWTESKSIEAIVVIDPLLTKQRKLWSSGDNIIGEAQFGTSRGG